MEKIYTVQYFNLDDGGEFHNYKAFKDYNEALNFFYSTIGKFFIDCIHDSDYSDEYGAKEGYSGMRDLSKFLKELYNHGFYYDTGTLTLDYPKEEKDFLGYCEFGTNSWKIILSDFEVEE